MLPLVREVMAVIDLQHNFYSSLRQFEGRNTMTVLQAGARRGLDKAPSAAGPSACPIPCRRRRRYCYGTGSNSRLFMSLWMSKGIIRMRKWQCSTALRWQQSQAWRHS